MARNSPLGLHKKRTRGPGSSKTLIHLKYSTWNCKWRGLFSPGLKYCDISHFILYLYLQWLTQCYPTVTKFLLCADCCTHYQLYISVSYATTIPWNTSVNSFAFCSRHLHLQMFISIKAIWTKEYTVWHTVVQHQDSCSCCFVFLLFSSTRVKGGYKGRRRWVGLGAICVIHKELIKTSFSKVLLLKCRD